jgi:hypothetical protein
MGSGSSTAAAAAAYEASATEASATEQTNSNGPTMNWEAASHAATGYDTQATDEPIQSSNHHQQATTEQQQEYYDDHEQTTHPQPDEDLSVAHETVQMIFDILYENGSHMTDEESMTTVLQTAKALANHSHASAMLMSTQRDKKTGDTLLHGAVRVGELEVVQFLLSDQFRFDINAQNWKGHSPLHISCSSGTNSAGIAEVLLEWGAWTEIQNLEGATPLILGAAAGDDMCIQTLLKYHASKETRDFQGYNALDWAQHYCHVVAVKELSGVELNQWLEYYDENSHLPYWYNTSTGESVWEQPAGYGGGEQAHTWAEVDAEGEHMPLGEHGNSGSSGNSGNSGSKEEESKTDQEASKTKETPRSESKGEDTSSSLTEKWRNIAWKVGRQRLAFKSNVPRLSRSPSRLSHSHLSPAPPTTPKPLRSPSRRGQGSKTPSSLSKERRSALTTPTSSSSSSSSSPMMSPNHGAQIHRQIEQLMKMQADMQEEMRRRLDAATLGAVASSGESGGAGTPSKNPQIYTTGLAAIEEERVNELELALKMKDDELAAIRATMAAATAAAEAAENTPSSSPSDKLQQQQITAEEHEASLIAARREVELELKKQKTSAEQATVREEKARAKEKEAMAKVEAMMEQLKKKEKAINESRELLNANVSLFCSLFCSVPPSYEYMSIRMYVSFENAIDRETHLLLLFSLYLYLYLFLCLNQNFDKNETKKALMLQSKQLAEAKNLAVEHENALQQIKRKHSTVQKELRNAKEQAIRQKEMGLQMKRMKEENERLRKDYEKGTTATSRWSSIY